MTGRKLFLQRLWKEWTFQYRVLRSVLDWSVIVYFVVPALIIMPFVYNEMWQDIHLYWNKDIPFYLLMGVVLLLLLRGNLRTFLYDADALFLLRQSLIFYPLKLWSFHYSLLQLIVGTGVLVVLILPILCLVYEYKITEVLLLFIILIACRLCLLTIKKIMARTLSKWSLLFIVLLLAIYSLTVLDFWLLLVISITIILGIYYLQLTFFVKTKRHFLQELDVERTERVQYIKLILSFSTEIEKTPMRLRIKPILFFPSKKMLQNRTKGKEYGLLELLLKGFLRNSTLINGYCNLIGITVFAVIFVPVWIKWIIFFTFTFFINSWLKSVYNKLLDNPFFKVIPYDEKCLPTVWYLFKRWIGIPALILVGGITLVLSFLAPF